MNAEQKSRCEGGSAHLPFRLSTIAFILCCAFATAVANAQQYPVKPVRMLIPWPPGGANDVVGRIVAQRLTEQLGQQVIVENRGGASGTIGADLVANPGCYPTAALLALIEGVLPPTAHLADPDPGCALRHVANRAERIERPRAVMSNSFAFGGSNVVLVAERKV